MKVELRLYAAAIVDGKICVFGGVDSADNELKMSKSFSRQIGRCLPCHKGDMRTRPLP